MLHGSARPDPIPPLIDHANQETDQKKSSNSESSTDAVSANGATIAPGQGDVSPSNIIAGPRMRHRTPTTPPADGSPSE